MIGRNGGRQYAPQIQKKGEKEEKSYWRKREGYEQPIKMAGKKKKTDKTQMGEQKGTLPPMPLS